MVINESSHLVRDLPKDQSLTQLQEMAAKSVIPTSKNVVL